MIRIIVAAICACAASLGGAFGAMKFKSKPDSHKAETVEKLETGKTRMISVPIISQNEVHGFVVARFEYVASVGGGKSGTVPLESYVSDEAFKVIYAHVGRDYKLLQKHDVAAITAAITDGVNKKVAPDTVRHVLIDSWMFLNKKEVNPDESAEH